MTSVFDYHFISCGYILHSSDTSDITKTDKTNHGCLGVLCI